VSRSTGLPALILLAGTSEAGESTAGQHLARCGARRLKIRAVLQALASGIEVVHEGVVCRTDFDPNEFLARLQWLAATTAEPVLVVESFIDAQLAHLTKTSWPAHGSIVFITADRQLRVRRHAGAKDLPNADSDRIVASKDARKHVDEQLPVWRQVTDHWIDNDGTLAALEETLSTIMSTTLGAAADQR
jgi:hypothetical protein